MNRSGVVGLARAVAFAMASIAAGAASARAETLDDRIAARLAIISEGVWETHRRCHGHEAGVVALLNRIRAHVVADDAAKLDEIIRRRDPSTTFGADEAFIADEKLPVDVAAGDRAFGDGELEWGAQALLPPGEQYAYVVKYGAMPKECADVWLKVDDVRWRVQNARGVRDQYPPDWLPPADDDRYP